MYYVSYIIFKKTDNFNYINNINTVENIFYYNVIYILW